MKLKRTSLFIGISSLALLMVLIIQVNWIFQTAKMKEVLFNEKADIILGKATEALLADEEMCKQMETHIRPKEIHKIDSLLKYYMNFYNFHIDYSFKIIKSGISAMESSSRLVNDTFPNQVACYQMGLNQLTDKTGWKIKLAFPEKKQYIKAEMGTLFITSILLILVVLFMFWRTTLALLLEKKTSEHTTDFLNNMTHEFKTPLTNIALAGKMIIKDSAGKSDKVKHYSEIILEENEKLRLQVEQVLSITALENGEIPLRKTRLDVHALIADLLKPINIQIENKNGSLKLCLNAGKFTVRGDQAHLTNVLSNLIDNAIKYSNENPHLIIQTSTIGEQLIIEVADQGIGIEKEYQNKVFDKFFRVSTGDVHDVKGFGLGLAYVKKIVTLHKGNIELRSEKGKGTTFIITLPHA